MRAGSAALCAAMLLLFGAAGAAAVELSVDEIVNHVQARFDSMDDLSAQVRQEVVLAGVDRTMRAEGSVTFKRPGRMRWHLKNDEVQEIVADGSTLWFYQPEEEQVLKAPFDAVFRSTTPISFLTGVGRIREDFEVTLDGVLDGRIRLALRPKRGQGEIGSLRLTVDETSYDVVEVEIADPLGNVTRLRFSELRRNTGLAEELFRFEVPPGVDVIEAPIGQ